MIKFITICLLIAILILISKNNIGENLTNSLYTCQCLAEKGCGNGSTGGDKNQIFNNLTNDEVLDNFLNKCKYQQTNNTDDDTGWRCYNKTANTPFICPGNISAGEGINYQTTTQPPITTTQPPITTTQPPITTTQSIPSINTPIYDDTKDSCERQCNNNIDCILGCI